MPEESFEQHARRRAEEFGIEPSAKVWQHVEAFLAPEERRRRVLFWWWLLPLCLAGGMATWLVKNEKAVPGKLTVVTEDGKRADNKTLKRQVEEKKGNIENADRAVEEKPGKQRESEGQGTLHYRTEIEVNDSLKTDDDVAEKVPRTVTKKEDKNLYREAPEQERIVLIKNEEKPLPASEDLLLQGNTRMQALQNQPSDSSVTASVDSFKKSQAKPDTVLVANDHSLSDKTVAGTTGKTKIKTQQKSWQAGVMAEAGLVSFTKGLPGNGNFFSGAFSASLPPNDPFNDNRLATGTAFQQAKKGVSTGAGILVKKPISDMFYVNAQLVYRYQQYEVYQYVLIPIPQPFGSIAYSVTKADYHAHFLSAGVYAGATLIKGKRNALSAEAGMDNGFLFVAKIQAEDGAQAARFGMSNITANFHRWQPQLSVALPFDWRKAGKSRLQIAPFTRFGLRTFQKTGASYKNNHLVSGGVQLVYFIK